MSAVLIRRVSWLMVLCGVFYVGSLAGTVRSDDSETESAKPTPADTVPPMPEGEEEERGNAALQAVGGLGIGHIQSTLGLIGVIADSLTKEIYNLKQVADLMNGTINGLETPKRMLRRLQESNLSSDDSEFLDRMIGVLNALQMEAKALVVFSKSRKTDDAQQFERARKIALKKLAELTQQEELAQPELAPTTSTVPVIPRSGKAGPASN